MSRNRAGKIYLACSLRRAGAASAAIISCPPVCIQKGRADSSCGSSAFFCILRLLYINDISVFSVQIRLYIPKHLFHNADSGLCGRPRHMGGNQQTVAVLNPPQQIV